MQLSIQENKHPFICELLKVGDSKGVSLVALHYSVHATNIRDEGSKNLVDESQEKSNKWSNYFRWSSF